MEVDGAEAGPPNSTKRDDAGREGENRPSPPREQPVEVRPATQVGSKLLEDLMSGKGTPRSAHYRERYATPEGVDSEMEGVIQSLIEGIIPLMIQWLREKILPIVLSRRTGGASNSGKARKEG